MTWAFVAVIVAAVILAVTATSDSGVGGILSMLTGKLSRDQIRSLAEQAGFSGGDLDIAVAVALAESGGDPRAVGDLKITAGGSVGLWQINLHYHPEYTKEELFDPRTNANAAYDIYVARGETFLDWSTFKTAAYLSYMPQGGAGGEVGV